MSDYPPIQATQATPPGLDEELLSELSLDLPEVPSTPTPVDDLLKCISQQPEGAAKVAAATAAAASRGYVKILDRSNRWTFNNEATGDLDGYATFMGAAVLPRPCQSWSRWTLKTVDATSYGTQVERPLAWIGVHIPVTGWYMINMLTILAPPMSAWTYFAGDWCHETDYAGSASKQPENHAMLVHLQASGYWHCFSYVLNARDTWVARITVQSVSTT